MGRPHAAPPSLEVLALWRCVGAAAEARLRSHGGFWLSTHGGAVPWLHVRLDERPKVRKTPRWPRSWASFSLLQLSSHRNAWADLHLLGQPNAFLAQVLPRPVEAG